MTKTARKGRNTQRKAVRQAALWECEQKYRRLLDTVQEGIWAADVEGVTTYLNPRMCILLCCHLEEAIGKSVFEFIDPSDLPAARMHFKRGLENLKDQFEFMLLRRDGTRVWAQLSSSASSASFRRRSSMSHAMPRHHAPLSSFGRRIEY